METQAQSVGEKEQSDFRTEIRKLKDEERSEEAQAQFLVSRSEYLKGQFARERESLVKHLETRLMVEREREREYGTAPGKGRPRSRSL